MITHNQPARAAHEFQLENLDGSLIRLSSLRGQNVLLVFLRHLG
jgi:peroxiredoxin